MSVIINVHNHIFANLRETEHMNFILLKNEHIRTGIDHSAAIAAGKLAVPACKKYCDTLIFAHCSLQEAQLSQRDQAAGWVSYGQKWKTETGRQNLQTL